MSIFIRRVSFVGFFVFATSLFAQLPATRLDGIFPAGTAPGLNVEVTVFGTNLDDVDRMVFSHEGIMFARKMAEVTPFDEGPQPVENVFNVSVAANVPPGNYDVRCQGKYGLSNRRTFVVSSLPEFIETEPNGGNDVPEWMDADAKAGTERTNPAQEVTLPVTINGQSSGGPDVDWYRCTGQAGQRILLDGHCKRIDSRMDLAVTLFTEAGMIIGESRAGEADDSLLDITLPANGLYFVKVHDALFAQGPGYVYRLTIGQLPYLDFVFPPAGQPGSNKEYTLYGRNLPDGQPSSFKIEGRPLDQLKVRVSIPGDIAGTLTYSSLIGPQQAGMDGIEYRVTNNGFHSNPVLITPSTAPTVLEAADNNSPDAPQKLTPPCEVAGSFYPQRDADWFSFDAKKEDVWAFDVYAERLGQSCDPALLIQRVSINDKGEQQAKDIVFVDDVPERNLNNRSGRHEFDERTTDPSYMFKAPEDGTYRILLKEAVSSVKSDPRLVYRLAIRKPQPDFRVVAFPDGSMEAMMLRKGGRDVVHILAFRQDDFDGEITVSAAGLPEGVTTEDIVIGPGNSYGTLILTATDTAPAGIGTLQVSATATITGAEVIRPARYGAALTPFQFNQPNARVPSVRSRVVERLQVCVSESEPAPQVLTIGEGKTLETSRGGILKIPYTVKRLEGTAGNIIGFPIDFPPNTTAQQVNIAANETGEFELRFLATAIPGTYSIYLAGFSQGMQYKRNPELAERAKTRQERIAKILMDTQQKFQDAQKDSQQKTTEATQAAAALTPANTQKTQADQKTAAALTALTPAAVALKQKTEQSAADPANEVLKQQLAQAQTAFDAAKKVAEDAVTAAAEAAKNQEEATAKKTAADEARAKAAADLQAAQQFQQQAQQEKQRADQFASQKQNEANPRGINVNVPSNSLTIKIVELPITVESLPDALTINQGEKAEVVVKVSRQYEFTGAISVQSQLPSGVGGISIPNTNIPDNQPEAKYEITAQPTATVGEHTLNIRFQMNFNGQNLVLERQMKLTVVEVKK
ncbi:MAG TPA: hypothetical protein PLR25_08725 [Planctomycetaceae bacterium]|nr:hypothetical protein [Planctomycetaceae bacterium]